MIERRFAEFQDKLIAATTRIADDYFQLPVADAEGAYRERVYCYELYHQLRSEWRDFPFSLGGEVDKGTRIFVVVRTPNPSRICLSITLGIWIATWRVSK